MLTLGGPRGGGHSVCPDEVGACAMLSQQESVSRGHRERTPCDMTLSRGLTPWHGPGAPVSPEVVELCPLVACVTASKCDWMGGPSWNDPGRMDGGRLQGV